MNELSPVLSFDVNLGKVVSDVTVDYDKLVTYMRRQGFNDANIADTPVFVSADMPGSHYSGASDTGTYYTHGEYVKDADGIFLYPVHLIKEGVEVDIEFTRISEGKYPKLTSEPRTSQEISRVLAHELEHKRLATDVPMQNANRQYHRKLVATETIKYLGAPLVSTAGITMGIEMVTQHMPSFWGLLTIFGLCSVVTDKFTRGKIDSYNIYLHRPEEQRCREVQKNAPDDLISVKFNPDYRKRIKAEF